MMSAIRDPVEHVLEPAGLGHELLLEWGQWYRDDRDGRESWSVKPRIDPCKNGEPPERSRFVDKVIAKHRLQYRNDWRVVAQRYLDDRMPWEIASRMRNPDGTQWAEGRVRALLCMMCGLIEREYRDWRGMS